MASNINCEKYDLIFYAYMTPILDGIGLQLKQTGCKVYCEQKSSGYDFRLLWRLKEIVKQHRISAIHTHDFGPMEYAVGLKCLMPRLRLIHSQHTLHGLLRRSDYLLFFQFASWFYQKLHMVSPTVLNEIKARSILLASRRCVVTYNGVSIGERPSLASGFLSPLKIVSICRVSPEKNIPLTLKALSLLKERGVQFKFVHCGEGSRDYTKKINDLVTSLDLSDFVEFRGFKSNIDEELNWGDIFISSSLTEGHPVAVIEAMERGLLCFLSDIAAHHFTEKKVAYFYELNPENLSNLIVETCKASNDIPNYQLRTRAVELIRERFSIHRMIDQYLDSYQG